LSEGSEVSRFWSGQSSNRFARTRPTSENFASRVAL